VASSQEVQPEHEVHLSRRAGSRCASAYGVENMAERGCRDVILRLAVLSIIEDAERLGSLPSEL
jgi:hypothetical protein